MNIGISPTDMLTTASERKKKITDEDMEKAITKALRVWLQPLRDLQTEKPIVNDFRFNQVSYDSTLPDLRVNVATVHVRNVAVHD